MLNKVYRKLPAGVGLFGGKWGEGEEDGWPESGFIIIIG